MGKRLSDGRSVIVFKRSVNGEPVLCKGERFNCHYCGKFCKLPPYMIPQMKLSLSTKKMSIINYHHQCEDCRMKASYQTTAKSEGGVN